MIRKTLRFSLTLFLALLLVFGIHQYILSLQEFAWNSHLILEAYITNFILVVISFYIILLFLKKQNFSLGFIFMGSFLLKMIVFMIFFNPTFKANDNIETVEFFSFFTPYSICLFFETIVLVRLLNRS